MGNDSSVFRKRIKADILYDISCWLEVKSLLNNNTTTKLYLNYHRKGKTYLNVLCIEDLIEINLPVSVNVKMAKLAGSWALFIFFVSLDTRYENVCSLFLIIGCRCCMLPNCIASSIYGFFHVYSFSGGSWRYKPQWVASKIIKWKV